MNNTSPTTETDNEGAPDLLSAPMRSSDEEDDDEDLLLENDDEEKARAQKELSHLVSDENGNDEREDGEANPTNDGQEDGEDNFEDEVTSHRSGGSRRSNGSRSAQRRWQRFLHKCILPDNRTTFYGIQIVDGPFAVKLCKFVGVTLLSVCFMHWFVRAMVCSFIQRKKENFRKLGLIQHSLLSSFPLFSELGKS